jgi:hypothetical protein
MKRVKDIWREVAGNNGDRHIGYVQVNLFNIRAPLELHPPHPKLWACTVISWRGWTDYKDFEIRFYPGFTLNF